MYVHKYMCTHSCAHVCARMHTDTHTHTPHRNVRWFQTLHQLWLNCVNCSSTNIARCFQGVQYMITCKELWTQSAYYSQWLKQIRRLKDALSIIVASGFLLRIGHCTPQSIKWLEYFKQSHIIYATSPFQYCSHIINCSVQCATGTRNRTTWLYHEEFCTDELNELLPSSLLTFETIIWVPHTALLHTCFYPNILYISTTKYVDCASTYVYT